MDTGRRIRAFAKLGNTLSIYGDGGVSEWNSLLDEAVDKALQDNAWFTGESVKTMLSAIGESLQKEALEQWIAGYSLPEKMPGQNVAVVMAGNVPAVGFHDLLCVLAAGHKVLAKPSSRDDRLIKQVAEVLSAIDPELGSAIQFTDDKLSGMDAVFATGSNNSARYFEYYFRDIPHIIRKNRNGVAVLSGKESKEELVGLGEDIFTYFGMGCRNVTKLYIPKSYDLKILLGVLDSFSPLHQHHKYGNNVDYYRTIYLMNQVDFLDNGILLLKEDPAIASPVGVVFYERYSEIGLVQKELELHREEIQCIVSTDPQISGAILPGSTQEPMPWDYADGVDTIRFLTEHV